MRQIFMAALAALPLLAQAAPVWQLISAEPGKRIELDRSGIKREDDGKVVARGRIVLEKSITDIQSGSPYRVIEALTRYDCASRNAATLKRIYKKDEDTPLREQEINGSNLPVRSGTLDDKVLREVCRPTGRAGALEVADKVNAAAAKLRAANAAMIQREQAKARIVRTGSAAESAAVESAAPPARRKPRPIHAPSPASSPPAHAETHWSYAGEGGPENWHKLNPRYVACASGDRQSPIDIQNGIKVDLEPIKFDYRPSAFRIVDNGHTIEAVTGSGSITITGKTYNLVQIHFHRPAEEKIDGRAFDMVAHLVHKSDDGRLAVVAVLMEKGAENPLVQMLWNYLPLEKNLPVTPPAASIDLGAFLPASRSYYTYMGSLTTPPCTEGVLWLVMKQPVQVSVEQIAIFSRLYPNNARPTQPAANRLIKEGR
ncbi:MAG: carbonic anhydrase [Betaproteobacteria bacterium]